MTKRTVVVAVAVLIAVLPVSLLLSGEGFGFIGAGFDKPGIPSGAHLTGAAGKGTITYSVNGSQATILFEGRCGSVLDVKTGPMDVSNITDEAAFLVATEKAIADAVENWFLVITAYPTQLANFTTCYGAGFLGVYVTAVNKSLSKMSTGPGSAVWVGEVTLQGVRF